MITNDARQTRQVKRKTEVAKLGFNKKTL